MCKGPVVGRVWRLCKSPLSPCLQRSQASLVTSPDIHGLACFTKVSFAARAAAMPEQSFLCCTGAYEDNCQWGHYAKIDSTMNWVRAAKNGRKHLKQFFCQRKCPFDDAVLIELTFLKAQLLEFIKVLRCHKEKKKIIFFPRFYSEWEKIGNTAKACAGGANINSDIEGIQTCLWNVLQQ